MEDFHHLLRRVGQNRLSHTAYDTAWVARLSDFDRNISNRALDWISDNQLPDGSWGVASPMYYHDRVVCTLSSMIALTYRGRRAKDKKQIERGLAALERITSGATAGLKADHSGATVAFELIVPILVAEAERLGLITHQTDNIISDLVALRDAKMAKFARLKVSRFNTLSHASEIAGEDKLDLLDVDNLQEANGGVGASPSATAHFALYAKPGDERALNYLRSISNNGDGGFPMAYRIEIFERIWFLWNLSLTGLHKTDNEIKALCAPHLDYLEKNWRSDDGLAFSKDFTPADSDDSALGFEILSKFGRSPKLDAVLNYEEEKWFRCFQHERNPSIDANIHVLGALKEAGYEKDHPSVKKIIRFIHSMRRPEGCWLDKWNVSPYYTTAHVIHFAQGYDDELCQNVAEWMLSEQQASGAWGSYGFQTAEETAYCLQALKIWQMYTGKVPKDRLEKAKLWLSRNCEPPYPHLWIDKSLYSPELLVKSSIISALHLAER